jgi:hypothetical protein
MTKFRPLLAVLACGVIVATACGSDSNSSSTTAASSATTAGLHRDHRGGQCDHRGSHRHHSCSERDHRAQEARAATPVFSPLKESSTSTARPTAASV